MRTGTLRAELLMQMPQQMQAYFMQAPYAELQMKKFIVIKKTKNEAISNSGILTAYNNNK